MLYQQVKKRAGRLRRCEAAPAHADRAKAGAKRNDNVAIRESMKNPTPLREEVERRVAAGDQRKVSATWR